MILYNNKWKKKMRKKWTLKVCENKNRWSSDLREIWNVKIEKLYKNTHKK